jgi:uncharacterized membrane protein YuzA (DUF378 family)
MKTLYTFAMIVTVFGALLWTFQAIGLNLISKLFGSGTITENIMYYFISLCSLIFLILFFRYKDYNENFQEQFKNENVV